MHDKPERRRAVRPADYEVPDGCPLCDGPIELRVTERQAHAVCIACRYFVAPEVSHRGGGRYELRYPPGAEC